MQIRQIKLVLLIALLFSGTLRVFGQNDYKITVNGKSQEIAVGKEYTIKVNGQDAVFKLTAKDTLVYDDELFSFNYFKDFKPTNHKLEEGIEQLAVITGTGTGFIIQKYTILNPENLADMMLQEVTKESVNYGFKMKKKESERKLRTGQKLNTTKATLTYKDQTNIYEIATYGKKDEGLIVMTIVMDEEANKTEKKFIDLLWASLSVK